MAWGANQRPQHAASATRGQTSLAASFKLISVAFSTTTAHRVSSLAAQTAPERLSLARVQRIDLRSPSAEGDCAHNALVATSIRRGLDSQHVILLRSRSTYSTFSVQGHALPCSGEKDGLLQGSVCVCPARQLVSLRLCLRCTTLHCANSGW